MFAQKRMIHKEMGSAARAGMMHFRMALLMCGSVFFVALIVARLFVVQVIDSALYREMAFGTRELTAQLEPTRGEVFLQNMKDSINPTPLILNEDMYLVFADGHQLKNADETATVLSEIAHLSDDERGELLKKIHAIGDDPYEPLIKTISEYQAEQVRQKKLPGIGLVHIPKRFYTEGTKTAHVTGFLGLQADTKKGQYGVEGYFDSLLHGNSGAVQGERDPFGAWIPLSEKKLNPAVDGPDIILTIDQKIQHVACSTLAEDARAYGAASATLIIMDPRSGAILALCNEPTFDPNNYATTHSISAFNNMAIFTAYEPGSVFKPFTVSAALDAEKITPSTSFEDKGYEFIDNFPIKNAGEKVYGISDIEDILVHSINTGTIFVSRLLGKPLFKQYVEKFGFGVLTGVQLDTEVTGTIESLSRKGDIYLATASFGQGITVTPMQLIAGYAAIANGGKLMKPQIVKEVRYNDGRVEHTQPQIIRQVISSRTAGTVARMLTAVVEKGHAHWAGVKGYRIAGKTGTAEIADPKGGYLEEYNHTFIGFGPSDSARFVMLVKYERPKERYADATTVHTFAKVAKFLVGYLNIPPQQ